MRPPASHTGGRQPRADEPTQPVGTNLFESIEDTRDRLAEAGYFPDPGLATSLFLAMRMEKALFLEGEPGVGKTEVARVLSSILDAPLIRLQCYEGLDINHAVYDWNYPKQLLAIQAAGAGGQGVDDIFSEAFLLRRPLLQAIDRAGDRPPVLLIDELDRADEEFESYLLELLDDFQITVPELGTFRADRRPITVITSNRTREVHDALKRRCIYHWIEYPSPDRELAIIRARVPEATRRLGEQVVAFVQRLRGEDLFKVPGVAESLDWTRALLHLGVERVDPETVDRTLGLLLKYQDDVDRIRGQRAAVLLHEAES